MAAARSINEPACRARAVAYAAFAAAVAYPDDELFTLFADGTWATAILKAAPHWPYAVEGWPLLPPDGVFPDLPSAAATLGTQYISLFESAGGLPLVSLYSGDHQIFSSRHAALEDVVRFYNHFGLRYDAARTRDMPDHLSTELEFLHYLAAQEAAVLPDATAAANYRRAARDFLRRHLLPWLPRAAERIAANAALRVYPDLFAALAAFVGADTAWLAEATGECVEDV